MFRRQNKYEIQIVNLGDKICLYVRRPKSVKMWPEEAFTMKHSDGSRTNRKLLFGTIYLDKEDAEDKLITTISDLKSHVADWNVGTRSERLVALAERLVAE